MDDSSRMPQALTRSVLPIMVIAGCMLIAVISICCWLFGQMIMFAFAGVLVAVLMRGIAQAVHRWTRLPIGMSLIAAILLAVLVTGGACILFGRMVESQTGQLVQSVPEGMAHMKDQLSKTDQGRWLLAHQSQASAYAGLAAQKAATMLTISLSALAGIILMVATGLFLAFQPSLYVSGLVSLVPPPRRARAREVLEELGYELRRWMLGQGLVMLIVGAILTIGLAIIHNQFALALGLLSALVTFVPYLGALLAGSIAILASIQQGEHVLGWTVLLYLVVYLFEGYCITPLVQRGTVELPPALIIIAQLAAGVVFGLLGLVFAAPLLVTILVLVKMLYLRDTLGDEVRLPGLEHAATT